MENIFSIEDVFYGTSVTRASVVLFNKAATNCIHITVVAYQRGRISDTRCLVEEDKEDEEEGRR